MGEIIATQEGCLPNTLDRRGDGDTDKLRAVGESSFLNLCSSFGDDGHAILDFKIFHCINSYVVAF